MPRGRLVSTWTATDPARRATLVRRARLLAAASVAYNTVEGAVALSAGTIAGSSALVGFGIDSVIEVSAGLIVLWQLRHRLPESRERLAQRLVAVSFFVLAPYLVWEAGGALLTGERADASPVGVALALASVAIMPFLSITQRRTGRELGSGAVHGSGTQTLLCTYLSAVLLIGLGLNAALGWWWADPVAALVIAAIAGREGWQTWRGEGCCAPSSAQVGESTDDDTDHAGMCRVPAPAVVEVAPRACATRSAATCCGSACEPPTASRAGQNAARSV
jgi:Co/Zn/Cd efflux system component